MTCSAGLLGAITGARSATSRTINTSTKPVMPLGLLASSRTKRRPPRGGSASRAIADMASALGIVDPRVEHAVKKVDHQGERNEQHGREQHRALDQGIVAPMDGVDRESAKAGPAEYV